MSAVLATDTDALAAAERALLAAHHQHNKARYLLAHAQAKQLFAQASECRAVAELETIKGDAAFATSMRIYAAGCEQRAREYEAQAASLFARFEPGTAADPELDA